MFRFFFAIFLLLQPYFSISQSQNDTLLVGYTSAPPFIILENEKIEGISVWLWNRTAHELNLNFKYVPMSFREMLDSTRTGGIDVSINPLTITSKRMKDMNFTQSFYASHSVVAKGKLSAFKRFRRFISSFFSFSFWSGFIILVFLIIFFGTLVWYFERKLNPQNFRTGWAGFWDGIWWSVVTMTTVGYGDKTPQSRGGKIVALVWMFSGLLFISGLTASVASSLTVDRLASDVSDLSDFKDRMIGSVKHSSSEQYLEDNFFKNISGYPNVSQGLDALVEDKIEAFVYDEPIIRYRVMNDPKYQNINVMPTKFKAEFYGFGLPKKHRELTDLISEKIINITERSDWQQVLKEYGVGEE